MTPANTWTLPHPTSLRWPISWAINFMQRGFDLPRVSTPDQMVDLFVKETQNQVHLDERGNSASAKITREHGEFMDVTGVKGHIAGLAQCSWQQNWIQAYKADDSAGKNAAINGLIALNDVKTTTPSKNGSFTGSIMAETNQKKALVGYIGRMRDGNFGFIRRVTALNCPAGT